MKRKQYEVLPRTDLARELYAEEPDSVIKRSREYRLGDGSALLLEEAQIHYEADSERFSKPMGKYITISSPKLLSLLSLRESLMLSEIISNELRYLLPVTSSAITVVGMGNREMTVDSFGVRCAEMIKPTRTSGDDGVSIVIPGVEASTGIAAIELITSVINTVKPAAIIAIDSLAARESARLGTTIQLWDSGIVPGSGLGRRNVALDRNNLGIPVVSIGIPTVISAKHLFSENDDCYVGLVESDAVIESAARIIAVAIEKVFV